MGIGLGNNFNQPRIFAQQAPQYVDGQYVQPLAQSYSQYSVPFKYKLDKKGNPTTTPLSADKQDSMAEQMIARAQYAYDNMMPPATLSQLFPTLHPALQQSLSQLGQSSGAGRFLSPSQAQQTGGVLGINFNAPTTKA